MTTYVVGDIQGCLKPLQFLLDEVNFDPATDTLWSAGDIVNRGPDCLETLRFLYQMRSNLVMVLGNHDLHLLALASGKRPLQRSDTLLDILTAPDAEELLLWLVQQPLLHHEDGNVLVHAGIPPQWSVEQARLLAGEVEDVLRSDRRDKYFEAMYGNKPALWSDDLKGMQRLRLITNYLTRMRFCTPTGKLDLRSKGIRPDRPTLDGEQLAPWFAHRKDPDTRILFGHWASLNGQTRRKNIIGLDTGCVWGGCLTFYALETGTFTHCECR
jgi:bis(5'-nucleosyl)-tetraphosphatase (symmetrical)